MQGLWSERGVGGADPPLPPDHVRSAAPRGEQPGGAGQCLYHLALPGSVLLQGGLLQQHTR